MERLRLHNLRVEEAGTGDEIKLTALLQRDEQEFDPDFEVADFVECAQEDFADAAQGHRKIWFAYADDAGPDPIGTVQLVFHENPMVAEIHFLQVASEYRGRGVSTALKNTLEQAAQARNIQQLILDVAADNTHAIHIYEERWGYQPLQMNDKTQNVLVMIKTLGI